MMNPSPIFDGLDQLGSFTGRNISKATPPKQSIPSDRAEAVIDDYRISLDFLLAYSASPDTFTSYRREIDRFLNWLWHVQGVSLCELTRQDIEAFLDFCKSPPISWRSLEIKRRFIEIDGLRQPNPEWKPFVVTISKTARRNGAESDIRSWEQSQSALKSMLRILRSFCQYLVDEDYIPKNPVAQLRSRYRSATSSQRKPIIRKLTDSQVRALFESIGLQSTSLNDDQYERLLFIVSVMIGLYLRISEIASTGERQPTFAHFYQRLHDSNGQVIRSWWFSVLGKGNKQREIPVSDDVMASLARYRKHLGLPALPSGQEKLPLFSKVKGKGAITSTRHVRMLLQGVFDRAAILLAEKGNDDEARDLSAATAHWLRHTGISKDATDRPLQHVQDAAGHSSLTVTGLYIDNDPLDAYLSAKSSKLLPDIADRARQGIKSA